MAAAERVLFAGDLVFAGGQPFFAKGSINGGPSPVTPALNRYISSDTTADLLLSNDSLDDVVKRVIAKAGFAF
ncbi:hypothetical protein LFM09_31395 [Lentzea alba]|uniref:hypothetical protein n=1 Tax=Lentzea alba TaxID=2714351 RepID=UPI0039BF4139